MPMFRARAQGGRSDSRMPGDKLDKPGWLLAVRGEASISWCPSRTTTDGGARRSRWADNASPRRHRTRHAAQIALAAAASAGIGLADPKADPGTAGPHLAACSANGDVQRPKPQPHNVGVDSAARVAETTTELQSGGSARLPRLRATLSRRGIPDKGAQPSQKDFLGDKAPGDRAGRLLRKAMPWLAAPGGLINRPISPVLDLADAIKSSWQATAPTTAAIDSHVMPDYVTPQVIAAQAVDGAPSEHVATQQPVMPPQEPPAQHQSWWSMKRMSPSFLKLRGRVNLIVPKRHLLAGPSVGVGCSTRPRAAASHSITF